MGLLRLVLLFGSSVIALALIVVPVLDRQQRSRFADQGFAAGLDLTSTGSVPVKVRYTVRRSVLQSSPDSVCILRANGARTGDCN